MEHLIALHASIMSTCPYIYLHMTQSPHQHPPTPYLTCTYSHTPTHDPCSNLNLSLHEQIQTAEFPSTHPIAPPRPKHRRRVLQEAPTEDDGVSGLGY